MMRVICSSCQAVYEVPDEKIPEKGMKVRCTKCHFVFEVKRAGQVVEVFEGEQKHTERTKAVEPKPDPLLKESASIATTPREYVDELEEAVGKFKRQKRISSVLGIAIIVAVAAVAAFLIWQSGIKPATPKVPPVNPEAVYLEAYDLYKKDTLDKYEEASEKLTNLLSAQPNFAKGFALLSMCQTMQAELKRDSTLFGQSRLNLKKALDLDRNLPEAYLAVAVLAIREKDYENASEVLNSAEMMAPENSQVYAIKGELFYRQGRLDDALIAFSEAVKRDVRDARSNYMLALILKQKGDYSSALARVNQALEISRTHYDAIQLKNELDALQAGKAGLEQKVVEQKPAEQKLSEQKPTEEQKPQVDEFTQNFNTARSLFNKGRSSAALSYAQKAVQLNPKSCQAKTLLGWIYLDTGNLEDAKEQFNAAVGGCPEALYGLGLVYKEQGQTQTAIMYIQRFLDTNPKGETASEASRLLITMRGE